MNPDDLTNEALSLIGQRNAIDSKLQALAALRPALTMRDITPDLCNIPDGVIEDQICRLRGQYDRIDCALLDTEDIDKWELVGGGSERFVVQADRRNLIDEIDGHNLNDEEVTYQVVDSETGEAEDFVDEDDATSAAEVYNHDDTTENLHGFPFAQTWGYLLEGEWEIEQFASCGFLVWRYDGDKLIAGIDGGGYSFDGQHWAPLFYGKRRGQTIDTITGPRRVSE